MVLLLPATGRQLVGGEKRGDANHAIHWRNISMPLEWDDGLFLLDMDYWCVAHFHRAQAIPNQSARTHFWCLCRLRNCCFGP